MQRTKYPPAFKDEAVKQVIDKYHLVVDVAKCLGIPDNALYAGVSKFKKADEPVSDQLQRLFQLDAPDQAWVTGITYISMHEAWLYLAAVLDLHSHVVVDWRMGPRMQMGLVLVTMAVWRRRPKESVIIH